MNKNEKEKKVVSKVNYKNFDEEIVAITKKSRIVRKSIGDSLHVGENTLRQIITV